MCWRCTLNVNDRALEDMKYLLQGYGPVGDLKEKTELPFQDIVSGEQLWVQQYAPEIAAFIGEREEKVSEALPLGHVRQHMGS
jgi:hypothetical protein